MKGRYGEDGGREVFSRLFPVILTDNGTEFSNPARIEFDADGGRLTSVFYCNAYASCQKAHMPSSDGLSVTSFAAMRDIPKRAATSSPYSLAKRS